MTNVRIVDEMIPPMTTVAKGFWTSEPSPDPNAIGKKPNEATSAVITTGLILLVAPSMVASLTDIFSHHEFYEWCPI